MEDYREKRREGFRGGMERSLGREGVEGRRGGRHKVYGGME